MSWTGSGGNPTLGAGGFVEAKYVRLFPRLVIVFFRINVGGTGFLPGSGQYRINAPYPFDPIFAGFTELLPIGKAAFFDASAMLNSSAFVVCYRPSDGWILMRPSTGDIWSATVPVAPGTSDRVSGYFMYPTAAA